MDRQQKANPENLSAINRLIERRRSFLTLPLIGFETELGGGREEEIERALLAEEAVSEEDFRVAGCPDLGSRGTRRAALCPVKPEITFSGRGANLQFSLPKGSYATVLLREYIKGNEYSHDSVERVSAEE
jgi:tRNA pseudouridine13 synthase